MEINNRGQSKYMTEMRNTRISFNYCYGVWRLGRQQIKDNFYFELNRKNSQESNKNSPFSSFLSFSPYSQHQPVGKGFAAKKCSRLLFVTLAWAVRVRGGQASFGTEIKPAKSLAPAAAFLLIFLKFRGQQTIAWNMFLYVHELKLVFTFLND